MTEGMIIGCVLYLVAALMWAGIRYEADSVGFRSLIEGAIWPFLICFLLLRASIRAAVGALHPDEAAKLEKRLAQVRKEKRLLELRVEVAEEEAEYEALLNRLLGS